MGGLRLVVRTFSELCLTVGTLIVLFVVYVLYWTGVQAESASVGQIDTLQREWADAPLAPPPAPGPSSPPAPTTRPYAPGKGIAVMYVPRLGKDWKWPVLEGATRRPEEGPRALRGHHPPRRDRELRRRRASPHVRRPLQGLPAAAPGDAVVLTDGTTWFTYRIDRGPYRTLPTDVGVVAPVPKPLKKNAVSYDGPGRYLTLTTCEPEWGSSHRLIVWAHLDATQPVTDGRPQALDS